MLNYKKEGKFRGILVPESGSPDHLDNDEELIVGGEEVPLRGVERTLVLAPLQPGLGAAARDALKHRCLANFHLKKK